MLKPLLQLCFFVLFSIQGYSQAISLDSLKQLRKAALNENLTNEEILSINRAFKTTLIEFLETSDWKKSPFDSIPYFARLTSPDKVFDLFCWNVGLADGEFKYFAIMAHHPTERVIAFTDQSDKLYDVEYKKLDQNNWFGALYYEVIPVKLKKEVYYTVLGWDGHNDFTTKKVIDAFRIDEKGFVRFDQIVFKYKGNQKSRVVFEYSERANMSLKYNEKAELIIFDHLAPFQEGAEGIFEFYGPDLSFDGFELSKGVWNFVEDVDARSPNTMENYIDPRKNKLNLNSPK